MPVYDVRLKQEYPFQAIQFTGNNFLEIARFVEYMPNTYQLLVKEQKIEFDRAVNTDIPQRKTMYKTDWLVRQHNKYYLLSDPYFTTYYTIEEEYPKTGEEA